MSNTVGTCESSECENWIKRIYKKYWILKLLYLIKSELYLKCNNIIPFSLPISKMQL